MGTLFGIPMVGRTDLPDVGPIRLGLYSWQWCTEPAPVFTVTIRDNTRVITVDQLPRRILISRELLDSLTSGGVDGMSRSGRTVSIVCANASARYRIVRRFDVWRHDDGRRLAQRFGAERIDDGEAAATSTHGEDVGSRCTRSAVQWVLPATDRRVTHEFGTSVAPDEK